MDKNDLWITIILMHCFVIVEVHCLDYVMCWFRLHQYILDDVNTLDDMYVFNRQGKKKDNCFHSCACLGNIFCYCANVR